MHLACIIPLLLTSLALYLAALPRCAASPLVSKFNTDKPGLSIEDPLWTRPQVDHKLSLWDPRSSSKPYITTPVPREDPREDQADIILSCQDGADQRALALKVVPTAVYECDVAFALNDSEVHLSDLHTTQTLSVTTPGQDIYTLQAELTCGFIKTESALVRTPLVSLRIQTVNNKQLLDASGFTISLSPDASIASVSLFQDVHVGERLETVTLDVPDLKTPGANAWNLLSHAQSIRELLERQQRQESSAEHDETQVTAPTQPATDNTTSPHKCASQRLRNKASCAAHSVCEGVAHALNSVLGQLHSTLGDDRATHYEGKVQTAMALLDSRFDCKKEKAVDQYIQVTITEVFENSTQSPPPTPQTTTLSTSATNPLVRALEVLAGVLGLGGLIALIKRRCCSLRRRVERLADREERVKAREYRRAARQEAWRKRWASVKRAGTCCFGSSEMDDVDEEKQALVINAAEEGRNGHPIDTAMAQLNGLYYAHEIVGQMAHSQRLAILDPADQRALEAAFPYANPLMTRSRASSLPSYNSEVLPDYSSQPDDPVAQATRVVDGFRRPDSRASTTGSSGFTPDSSIPEISPRPSAETLRTQYSSRMG